MKILFISAANSTHTVRWVNALAKYGHQIVLAYNRGHEPKEDVIDGTVEQYRLKYGGTAGYYLNAIEIRKLVKRIKPDIINVHYASGYGTLSRIARLKNTILSVWGSDVYEFPYESSLKNKIVIKNLRSTSYLASTSKCMANQVRKLLNQSDMKIEVTPFGVDLDLFDPEYITDKKSEDIIIGNVKSLKENYGIRELIISFSKLKQMFKNDKEIYDRLKLHIYGDGEQRQELLYLIDKLGESNAIFLKGKIPNNKVPEVLSEFDVFCALSHKESFGVSIIEAMAMKKPVVTSAADGFKEVVVDKKTGYIVNGNNLEEVAQKLRELILDKNLRVTMGEAGRQHVEEEFNWNNNVKTMIKLYERVYNENKSK